MLTSAKSIKQISIFDVVICSLAGLIGCLFVLFLGHIIWNGIGVLNWDFIVSEPINAGRAGGIWPIIVSTLFIMLICMSVATPIGIGTAILLAEFTKLDSAFSRSIRISLNVLAGIPSIVFGLFGNAFFCKFLGLGFSILSGGLTLACMVLPILIKTTEESLRAVPHDFRRSSAALGFSKTSAIFNLILPTALPGIAVGLALGLGRAIAETAALIFTSGYVDRMPASALDSGRALAIHIFDLSMNVTGGDRSAYGTSLVLMMLLLLINIISSLATTFWMQKRITAL